jgi:shikimate kinase
LIANGLMILNKTVFLVGMMGSGKSTIGARLAALLSLPFIDTDEYIEKEEGRSVRQIFEQEGEAYFREREQHLLQHLPSKACVVACGGGLPCFQDQMKLLLAKGTVIYLDAKPELMFQRIQGDVQRPKLQDLATFTRLKAEREAIYRNAHLTINAAQAIDGVLDEIVLLLENQ